MRLINTLMCIVFVLACVQIIKPILPFWVGLFCLFLSFTCLLILIIKLIKDKLL